MSDAFRDGMEQKAEETRQRLMEKVDLLEQRKHAVENTVREVRSFIRPMMWASLAAAVLTTAVVVANRRKTRRARAIHTWHIGRAEPPPSMVARLSGKLLINGLALVGTRLLQVGINRVLPAATTDTPAPVEQSPSGRAVDSVS